MDVRIWYLGIPLAVFGAAALAVVADLPVREIALGLFLLIGPGAAIVWLAGVRDQAGWLALVVPTSLAIDALVTAGLLYLGIWAPELAVVVVTAITVVAVGLVPFERGARVALIVIALLPGLVLVAAELAAELDTPELSVETRVVPIVWPG